MSDDRFGYTGPLLATAPIATGFAAHDPGNINLGIPESSLPRACSVKELGVIMGCVGIFRERTNHPHAHYRWDDTGNVVRCRHCLADVTAAQSTEGWRTTLAPAVPALPSPNSRANELHDRARSQAEGLRGYIAEGRPAKALEYIKDEVVWSALDAIAAGCDDPAGLARDLAALHAEAIAARDVCEDG